ncbi:hypothetical protein ABZP36_035916 [Zizania latifolia]
MAFGGYTNSRSGTDGDMGGEGAPSFLPPPSSWRVDATPLRDALHTAVDELRAGLGLPPVTEAMARRGVLRRPAVPPGAGRAGRPGARIVRAVRGQLMRRARGGPQEARRRGRRREG